MELTPVLRAEALCFRFDTRTMFEGLSLALPGGVTWLRGANGKGKTTLLKMLGGALAPHTGSIELDGLDSTRDALSYRGRSFLCGGETPALPWLTVRELLDLHVALFAGADSAEVARQLGAFEVADTLAQPLATLSLGQYKKVQLALALSLPVRLLLLDEPFNGLDAQAMLYLREQLALRGASACIVLASHVDPQLPLAGTLDL
jgi:ABC-2 type transport system ATP-binding protein